MSKGLYRFDLLLSNSVLREEITKRLKHFDVDIDKLAIAVDSTPKHITNWLNTNNATDPDIVRIKHDKVLSICDRLGIRVKLQVELYPLDHTSIHVKDIQHGT